MAYQAHKNMDYREVLREIEERTPAIRNLLNLIMEKQVKTIKKQIDKFQGTENHQLLVFGSVVKIDKFLSMKTSVGFASTKIDKIDKKFK